MTRLIDFRIKPPVRDTASDPVVAPGAILSRYDEVYGMTERINVTVEELTATMEAHGVRGILQAEFEEGGRSRYWNERVADLVGRRPDLFIGGIASVDPTQADALEELRWAHDELGLRGVVFQPGFLGLYPNDPRCFPIYAFCEARGLPVTLHSGVNFTPNCSIDFGRPIHIDHVACAFPNLTIVCNHGGWPWITESIAVAWKHRHVYLEFGAIAPKYMAHPHGGWQPMPHWMRTQLRHKVLLGTDWPMLSYDRLLEELPLLELGEEALAAYTHGNAERIIDAVWG